MTTGNRATQAPVAMAASDERWQTEASLRHHGAPDMTSNFYMPRSLTYQDKTLTEAELLKDEEVVVLLAEPGAGKTDLLGNIASKFKVQRQKASIFKERTSATQTNVLILDALDEVARLDSSGVQAVLVKAMETGANRVILASRSSEWEESQSVFIRDCFGREPQTVYLQPFDDAEQSQLFSDYVPGEDFSEFKLELAKFELHSLLGNPQFLKLFADAFVESGRRFNTKREIFDAAVRRLTHEANSAYSQKNRPPVEQMNHWAREVFAKLLLSGAVGVSIRDNLDERHFPRLTSLVSENNDQTLCILDTRLLRPSSTEGEHEPVHRIVAEYCAAGYLASRINDPTDLLSLKRCLSIIAPNSVVRDELRGLLGWMAALGSKTLQEAAIDLDPYAVLANGDPSQLSPSSKRRLLAGLKETAEQDPYFRRGDTWRTFSLSGFFSTEVLEGVKSQLLDTDEHGHLRNLLLEMLQGSDAVSMLVPELRALMLNTNNTLGTRMLAHRNLIAVAGHDHKTDCTELIRERSLDAVRISVEMFQNLGVATLGRDTLLALLRRYAQLYLERNRGEHLSLGFHIKRLIKTLDLCDSVWLLDQLTEGLACTCSSDQTYNCTCRNGISKVIGLLLDGHFEKTEGPFDAVRICQWVRNLKFERHVSQQESEAVRVLHTQRELRQSIQHQILHGITNPDEVRRVWHEAFGWQSHAGLSFQVEDCWALVDYAFHSNNPVLWARFPKIRDPQDRHGPDALRAHMRWQANQKRDFMGIWSKQNRESKSMAQKFRVSDLRHRRRIRRQERQENQIRSENLQNLKKNRTLIESGRHRGWLRRFAYLYLMHPETLSVEVDDPQIAENALCNCLPSIEPTLPTLQKLAEFHCNAPSLGVETELYAACLSIFRRFGSLASIKKSTLAILKTDTEIHYDGIDEETRTRFLAEIDRQLFGTNTEAERFARQYLEPQLRYPNCTHTKVRWLRQAEFSSLVADLPLEWLRRFPGASLEALGSLFQLAVEHCDQRAVLKVIRFHMRYVGNSFFWRSTAGQQDLAARRAFWFLRSFSFEKDCPEEIQKWLKSDPETIFALEGRFSAFSRIGNKGWPDLAAAKVFLILDAFIEAWPKVYLPNQWGTGDPKEQTAYRFLRDIVWTIAHDDPEDSLPVLEAILADERFGDFHDDASSMRASALRKKALRDFEPPSPSQIVELLDKNQVTTVEDLRKFLIQILEELQSEIKGSEFDPVDKFYSAGERVDEETASKRIADDLQKRLKVLNTAVAIEHHLKDDKRCDITATKMFSGMRRLLVIEVKGQWNRELFEAAAKQLHQRYAIHPDAEHQGIYLVLWFGNGEEIAGRRDHSILSPSQLREKIVAEMPKELHNVIDVFVLDLSLSHGCV